MSHGMTTAIAPLVQRVFQALSAMEFRSGEQVASSLQVTRAAVWKAVEQLRELQVPLEAVANRGYRLGPGYAALEPAEILQSLAPVCRQRIATFETVWSLPSTNDYLLGLSPPAPGKLHVALAECQTAGRGRRGRAWIAPPGGSICLSFGWTFAELPPDIASLALAMGVCTQRAIAESGIAAVRLKWPNDLVTADGKLAGILLELRAEASGPAYVVVGMGINAVLPADELAAIAATGTRAVDLQSLVDGTTTINRNRLIAAILRECVAGLLAFEAQGFAACRGAWLELDALRGRQVNVQRGNEIVRGLARGIDSHGQLLLETPDGVIACSSGDVSVRPAGN